MIPQTSSPILQHAGIAKGTTSGGRGWLEGLKMQEKIPISKLLNRLWVNSDLHQFSYVWKRKKGGVLENSGGDSVLTLIAWTPLDKTPLPLTCLPSSTYPAQEHTHCSYLFKVQVQDIDDQWKLSAAFINQALWSSEGFMAPLLWLWH